MINSLCTEFDGGKRVQVDSAQLDQTERQLDIVLPPLLREFYSQTDGLTVHDYSLELTDLTSSTAFATAISSMPLSQTLGLFPFTESNDSNPFCVCCRPPLFGRIIHLRHDDVPQIAFRDLDDFASAVLTLASTDDWMIDDLVFGYNDDHSDRTSDDDASADRLLAANCDDEDNAVLLAMSLLSHRRIGSIVDFLSHQSMWVREEAARQLGLINDPIAIEPLEQRAVLGSDQDNSAARRAVDRIRSV